MHRQFVAAMIVTVCTLNASLEAYAQESSQRIQPKKLGESNLEDRVTSLERQVVILSKTIEQLQDVLKKADADGRSTEVQFKVFKLVNADAESVVRIVSIVVPEVERETLRVAADRRTNIVFASGFEQDLAVLEALILRLDQGNASKDGK
ncbi:MAG: hypothetical protein IH987_18410 [Planctomycetes bacterium]|nr:hypothetical protein [Planctomycetota bacterium]